MIDLLSDLENARELRSQRVKELDQVGVKNSAVSISSIDRTVDGSSPCLEGCQIHARRQCCH